MALATIAQLKAYLGITTAGSDDLLTALLAASEQAVVKHLDRNVESASYTAVMDGNGSSLLTLAQYPITAVSSVKIDGRVVPQSSGYGVSGFLFRDREIILRGEYRFTLDTANVEIVYTAGYSQVPADINQAVLQIAALRYKERDWTGYQSKSLAGETVAFETSALPPAVLRMLQPYLNVVPV